MATISVLPVLEVANVTDTTVNLTVRYTLTPNNVEKLAGTVFGEDIDVIGNDLGTVNDIVLSKFPKKSFAVHEGTNVVLRERTMEISKSLMNEDSGFTARGSEQRDEVFARVTLKYNANPPLNENNQPRNPPPPADSNQVKGMWHG